MVARKDRQIDHNKYREKEKISGKKQRENIIQCVSYACSAVVSVVMVMMVMMFVSIFIIFRFGMAALGSVTGTAVMMAVMAVMMMAVVMMVAVFVVVFMACFRRWCCFRIRTGDNVLFLHIFVFKF